VDRVWIAVAGRARAQAGVERELEENVGIVGRADAEAAPFGHELRRELVTSAHVIDEPSDAMHEKASSSSSVGKEWRA
jgi:hypothetical protein